MVRGCSIGQGTGRIFWAVSTSSKSDALNELGADETISRETDLTAEPGVNNVDVVIDLVAGDESPQLLEVLRPGGRYACPVSLPAGRWNWISEPFI